VGVAQPVEGGRDELALPARDRPVPGRPDVADLGGDRPQRPGLVGPLQRRRLARQPAQVVGRVPVARRLGRRRAERGELLGGVPARALVQAVAPGRRAVQQRMVEQPGQERRAGVGDGAAAMRRSPPL
jgi:hypothetical protein